MYGLVKSKLKLFKDLIFMQDQEIKHQKPAESGRILLMIVCLTVIFIALQSFLFFVHYRVSELVDSLINSSITSAIFQAKLLSSVLIFLGIQLIAYGVFISWVWFLSVAICELFVLKGRKALYLSIAIWLLACLIMLGLNQYFYPHSFFANQYISNVMTVMALIGMFILTVLAYINVAKYQSYRIPGLLFVTLVLIVGLDAVGYHYFSRQDAVQTHPEPNILLIGLDSLRPDFTGYFSEGSVHTPNIDSFLSSASTFTHAYSPLARTFPAWMTVLTAKYPKHNGARNNLAYPQQLVKEDTLAKELKK
jgi:hypothetical protein